MDCAVEEAEIRRALDPIAGIRALGFQLRARTLTVDAEPAVVEHALQAIRHAGFQAEPASATGDACGTAACEAAGVHSARRTPSLPEAQRLGLALALALVAEGLHLFAGDAPAARYAGMAVALVAIALAGLDTYRKGLAALRRARLTISALMAVAVTGAFLIGEWPEAAMVMVLYAIAEAIEARALDRSREAVQTLLALAPSQAQVRQPDGSWRSVAASEVPVGATVRVRAGERVPLDGAIVEGEAAFDESALTGESLPVQRGPGDAVRAGTINSSGLVQVDVQAPYGDSLLARIIRLVEQAQGARAPMQRFVDRFAAFYTPAVFTLALALALGAPLLLGWPWAEAAYRALVLLVIACPCALVISTPVTVVSALAAAARRGVLIKGGAHLEAAAELKVVAFDKTGTLTTGRPELVAWAPWDGTPRAAAAAAALALAGSSDHPVSRAIAAGLAAEATLPLPRVTAWQDRPGRGSQALLDGVAHRLGSAALIEQAGLLDAPLRAALAPQLEAGHSVTLVADDRRVLAWFAVADRLRPAAADAVAELHRLGLRTALLSGDHPAAVQHLARQAGIAEAAGGLLPDDKLERIAALQRAHGRTAMAGDGINDAPALARADLGFAMGGAGTDTAIEAADVVVMNDDLRRIGETVRLSRRTRAVLWQNIALALGIKAAFLVAAAAGLATLWMAVFADVGASLLVVANGLRLLRWGAASEDGPRVVGASAVRPRPAP